MNNRTESQRDDHLHKILDATRKTTPSASASVASRHFLDDADTPPCGDARRGITLYSRHSPYSNSSSFTCSLAGSHVSLRHSPKADSTLTQGRRKTAPSARS